MEKTYVQNVQKTLAYLDSMPPGPASMALRLRVLRLVAKLNQLVP